MIGRLAHLAEQPGGNPRALLIAASPRLQQCATFMRQSFVHPWVSPIRSWSARLSEHDNCGAIDWTLQIQFAKHNPIATGFTPLCVSQPRRRPWGWLVTLTITAQAGPGAQRLDSYIAQEWA